MASIVNYTFNIQGNAINVSREIASAFSGIAGKVKAATSSFRDFGKSIVVMNQGIQLAREFSQALQDVSAPGLALNTAMHDLSAITGVTGAKLKEVEGYARAAAKTFGGSAAQGVESYKLILSQLSPEIAKVPAALSSMGHSVALLSKTMGGDAAAATQVLTTAMNQFQVSTKDPIEASRQMAKMMNVMSAAAQAGSAELPQIKAALEQSGMAAKAAAVSFGEANAAIQVLDKAGKKGSEGGIALRNTLATLSQGRFLPKDTLDELLSAGVHVEKLTDKTTSLADRLDVLRPILKDDALLVKLFGRENSNAALALISGTTAMRDYTIAVEGTSSAEEQAAIVMESKAEIMARYKAKIDDLKISMFNFSGNLLPMSELATQALIPLGQMMPVFGAMAGGIGKATKALKGFNITMKASIIGLAISGIGAVAMSYVNFRDKVENAGAAIEEYNADTNKSVTVVGTQISKISELTERYNDLKTKANLTTTEQTELATVIGEISTIVPSAITAIGEYNRVLDIDAVAVEGYTRKQKELFAELSKMSATGWMDELKSAAVEIDILEKELSSGFSYSKLWGGTVGDAISPIDMSVKTKEIQILQDRKAMLHSLLIETGIATNDIRTVLADMFVDGTSFWGGDQRGARDKELADFDKFASELAFRQQKLQAQDKELAVAPTGTPDPPAIKLPKVPLIEDYIEEELDYDFKPITGPELIIPSPKFETIKVPPLPPLPMDVWSKSIKQVTSEFMAFGDANTYVSAKAAATRQAISDLIANGWAPSSDAVQSMVTKLKGYDAQLSATEAQNKIVGTSISEGIGIMGQNIQTIGGAFSGAAGGWVSFAGNILSSIPMLITQMMAMSAAVVAGRSAESSANAGAAVTGAVAGSSGLPFPYNLVAMGVSVAATIAALAVSVPKFANGGIVSGPTMALVGEYAGASNNPEVIAPLNKLKSLLNTDSSGIGGQVVFTIEGRQLVGILTKEQHRNNRTR